MKISYFFFSFRLSVWFPSFFFFPPSLSTNEISVWKEDTLAKQANEVTPFLSSFLPSLLKRFLINPPKLVGPYSKDIIRKDSLRITPNTEDFSPFLYCPVEASWGRDDQIWPFSSSSYFSSFSPALPFVNAYVCVCVCTRVFRQAGREVFYRRDPSCCWERKFGMKWKEGRKWLLPQSHSQLKASYIARWNPSLGVIGFCESHHCS